MDIKKILAGAKGSESGIYRSASPLAMILGCATSGSKMVWYMLMAMTSYAANEGFGIAVAVTGVIITIKSIFDGVSDPIVAGIFDRMKVGKHGKIRIFLWIGFAIQTLSAVLMFNVLAGKFKGVLGTAIYIIIYFLFVIGYTVQSIGGTSIPTMLTNDPVQRPFMNFAQMVWRYLGPIVSSNIITFAVLPRYNDQYSLEMLHEACFWYIGMAAIFLLLSTIGLSKVDTPEILGEAISVGGKQKKVGIREMWELVKDNKPLRCYVVTGVTDKIASNTGSQQIVLTMMNGILIANYGAAQMVNNASTIIGFIFAFLGGIYIARFGCKQATTVWSAVSIAINVVVFAVCIILGPTGMAKIGEGGALMMMYVVLQMAKTAGGMILSTAEGMMRADITDYELDRSGAYMPGTVGAVYTFIEKIVASLGATIASFAVAAIGYKDVMPQKGDPATWPILWVTMFLMCGMPVIGWICNIVAMRFYELDKNRMVEIQTSVAEKKKAAKAAMKAEK